MESKLKEKIIIPFTAKLRMYYHCNYCLRKTYCLLSTENITHLPFFPIFNFSSVKDGFVFNYDFIFILAPFPFVFLPLRVTVLFS